MKGYKTTDTRLVNLFKDAREKWRKRALSKQKKLRAMDIKVRDLSLSREKWKEKAKQLEASLKEKELEIEELKKTSQPRNQSKADSLTVEKSKSREIIALKPAQYTYPVFIIQIAIQQRIISFSSWRAIEKNFKLWAQFFNLPTPDFTTIRQWFLILGLSYQKWSEKLKSDRKNLQHHDLEVLALEVLDSTKGEILEVLINNLAKTVGKPLQIISDHGSDLKKGIELYISNNPGIIYTYDFTHQVALWLKKELSKNAKFQELLNQCNLTRSQIQQTKLSFLTPPSQRAKARYHNIDLLVTWGLKVLEYWNRQDFSLISTEFIIDRETLFILRDELDQTCLKKLPLLLGIKAPDFISFSEVMTKKLGQKLWEEKGKLISQAAELGQRKFLEKLGWLLNYEKELHIYAEILEVFALAKKQLIQQGIHPFSQQDWLNLTKSESAPSFQGGVSLTNNFADSPLLQKAQQKVSQYLAIEAEKIPKNQAFLATSDIIESIFGKYKIFASSSPNSEINEMILTLLLSTTKLTPDKVLQAMETIHLTDVDAWSQEVFGQSILSKRKLAFSTSTNCIKVA